MDKIKREQSKRETYIAKIDMQRSPGQLVNQDVASVTIPQADYVTHEAYAVSTRIAQGRLCAYWQHRRFSRNWYAFSARCRRKDCAATERPSDRLLVRQAFRRKTTLFRVRERSFQTFDFRLERQFAVSIHLGGRVEAELLVLGVEGFRIILKLSMVWGRPSTNNCSPPAAMPALYW